MPGLCRAVRRTVVATVAEYFETSPVAARVDVMSHSCRPRGPPSRCPLAAQRRHSVAAQRCGTECAVFRTLAEVCVIAPTSTSPSATWHAGTVRHFTSRCNAQSLTCSNAVTACCNGCGDGAVQPLRDRSLAIAWDRYKSQPN